MPLDSLLVVGPRSRHNIKRRLLALGGEASAFAA